MVEVTNSFIFVLIIMGLVMVTDCENNRKHKKMFPHRKINKSGKLMNLINYKAKYANPEITIPVIINIDNVLLMKNVEKYGKNARRVLKNYIRKTVKGINRIFLDPSLGQKVLIEALDINFLKNNSKVLQMSPYASKYLNRYCSWQSTKKERENTWYSILLTGLDLYYFNQNGAKVLGNEARSYRNGMCNLKKSCAVAEGFSSNLVHILTHEISHSLGIHHDGGGENECPSEGYIMASRFNRNNASNMWSSCSGGYLSKYLRSKMAWCLK